MRLQRPMPLELAKTSPGKGNRCRARRGTPGCTYATRKRAARRCTSNVERQIESAAVFGLTGEREAGLTKDVRAAAVRFHDYPCCRMTSKPVSDRRYHGASAQSLASGIYLEPRRPTPPLNQQRTDHHFSLSEKTCLSLICLGRQGRVGRLKGNRCNDAPVAVDTVPGSPGLCLRCSRLFPTIPPRPAHLVTFVRNELPAP